MPLGAVIVSAAIGAVFGLGGGVVSASVTERLKSAVSEIEIELARADELGDLLIDVSADADAEPAVRRANLRRCMSMRRRLGENARRYVTASDKLLIIGGDLNALSRLIGQVEDEQANAETFEGEVGVAVDRLRRSLRSGARNARSLKMMRST